MYSPVPIENAPATRAATPVRITACGATPPPPSPAISEAFVTRPSTAPNTVGRSQPPDTSRCRCDHPAASAAWRTAWDGFGILSPPGAVRGQRLIVDDDAGGHPGSSGDRDRRGAAGGGCLYATAATGPTARLAKGRGRPGGPRKPLSHRPDTGRLTGPGRAPRRSAGRRGCGRRPAGPIRG